VRAIGGHHDFDGLACTNQEVAMIALASMIASDLRNKRVPRLTQKLPADAVDCLELSDEELELFLEHSYDLCRQSRAA
jgi:hypothetical protein